MSGGVPPAQQRDRARLAEVARDLRAAEGRVKALREERATIVLRLRGKGTPMAVMAHLAGVTDSYLSRLTLRRGAPPRRATREDPVTDE